MTQKSAANNFRVYESSAETNEEEAGETERAAKAKTLLNTQMWSTSFSYFIVVCYEIRFLRIFTSIWLWKHFRAVLIQTAWENCSASSEHRRECASSTSFVSFYQGELYESRNMRFVEITRRKLWNLLDTFGSYDTPTSCANGKKSRSLSPTKSSAK